MYRRTIWDYWANRYERVLAQHFSLGPARRLIHEHLDAVAPEARRILDIGCGVGQLAHELALKRPSAEIIAVDSSLDMITHARRDHAAPNITHIHGSLKDIPKGLEFDIITSTHSFPYFRDKQQAAATIYHRMCKGGRFLIIQANTNNIYDAVWLFFVKFTTTTAEYFSVNKLVSILQKASFQIGLVRSIDKCFFIPSIYLVEGIK